MSAPRVSGRMVTTGMTIAIYASFGALCDLKINEVAPGSPWMRLTGTVVRVAPHRSERLDTEYVATVLESSIFTLKEVSHP